MWGMGGWTGSDDEESLASLQRAVDLGCTLDNYHGLFRSWRGDDGDLDYYVLAGPTVPQVTRRFSWLTGGQAFAPRWSFGFACTSMAIADAPDPDATRREGTEVIVALLEGLRVT